MVVLGDIGRSPRIKNHALELANNGYQVDFVGYIGILYFMLQKVNCPN